MALTRLGGANAITGTIPQGNIANASLGAVTTLPAGVGGKVLQVVQTVDTTNRSSNSSSFVSTGVEVSITPSATSSKVFLMCNWSLGISANNRRQHTMTFYRDTTDLTPSGVNGLHNPVMPADNATYHLFPQSMSLLDSPSSTSAITYKFMWKINSSYQYLGRRGLDTNHDGATVLTAMEIAG